METRIQPHEPSPRLLRKREDRISLAWVAGSLLVLAAGATALVPMWVALPSYLVLLRWVGLVQHNHLHYPVFESDALNRALSLVVSFQTGTPSDMYWYHHVAVHHRYNCAAEDWTSPFSYRSATFPRRPVHVAVYIVTFIPRAIVRVPSGLRRTYPRRLRPAMVQAGTVAVLVLGCVVALALDSRPTDGLLLFVVPVLATWLFLPIANWRHHVGCDFTHPDRSAYNSESRLSSGRLGLGIGAHVDHHKRPGRHWSELTGAPPASDRSRGQRPMSPSSPHLTRYLLAHERVNTADLCLRSQDLPQGQALEALLAAQLVEADTPFQHQKVQSLGLRRRPDLGAFFPRWLADEADHAAALDQLVRLAEIRPCPANPGKERERLTLQKRVLLGTAGRTQASILAFLAIGAAAEYVTNQLYLILKTESGGDVRTLLDRLAAQERQHMRFYLGAARASNSSSLTGAVTRRYLRSAWVPVGVDRLGHAGWMRVFQPMMDEKNVDRLLRMDRVVDSIPGLEGLELMRNFLEGTAASSGSAGQSLL